MLTNTTIEKQLREQLDHLPIEQKHKVLEFARSLDKAKVRGVPGKDLLRFAGTIDSEDLKVIESAINEGCEKLNPDEW
jgi:hypothetical protein